MSAYVFAAARWLLALMIATPTLAIPTVTASQSCDQPTSIGCVLSVGLPVEAIVASVGEAHLWLLTVPEGSAVDLMLASGMAPYRLAVFDATGELLAASDTSQTEGAPVQLTLSSPGDYALLVEAPSGQAGAGPYRLAATAAKVDTTVVATPPPTPREASPSTIVVVLTPDLDVTRTPAASTATPITASPGSSRSTHIGTRTRQVLPFDPFGPIRQCQDFASWALAQDFFEAAGGPQLDRHGLDPDRDGIACADLRERDRPAAPASFAGAYDPSNTSIRFTWQDRSVNELGYKLDIQTTAGLPVRLIQLPANTTATTVTGLSPQNTYCYFLWAYGEWTESDRAVLCDTALPAPPAGLSVTLDPGSTAFRLTWQDRSDNELGFKVDVQAQSGAVIRTITVPANTTTTTITGLSPTLTYCFYVLAFSQFGESERARICN